MYIRLSEMEEGEAARCRREIREGQEAHRRSPREMQVGTGIVPGTTNVTGTRVEIETEATIGSSGVLETAI